MADSRESVLGATVVRLLDQRLDLRDRQESQHSQLDHRRKAALEIEQKVRALAGDTYEIKRILDCLQRDYIENHRDPSCRKGGLIGLASVAIGLDSEVGKFLQQLVDTVLKLFEDGDNRVRYYACEALYNIAKVARGSVLAHFNDIFDGLCRLSRDDDTEVKHGVQVLDTLMQSIVTESHSMLQVRKFVYLLADRMQHKSPFIRNMCLCWIQLLLKVPEADVVVYLHVYLKGIFTMLGDQSREIKVNADACLIELLRAVTSSERQTAFQIISETAAIVVGCCVSAESCERLTSLCWVHEFVRFQTHNHAWCSENWVNTLPELLAGTLVCIDGPEDEIKRMAVETNGELLELTHRFANEMRVEPFVDKLLSHPYTLPRRSSTRIGG
ncbi:unnamed protein product [Prorocentrum cordatum]|uniref:Protein VAC14 homolog n=1 Tax=Prorocentrum cordatum TaxID=2364126 RepID=A0ABN9VEP1_9DINO|nr:unnamed protein product [Polarella glacialis]